MDFQIENGVLVKYTGNGGDDVQSLIDKMTNQGIQ